MIVALDVGYTQRQNLERADRALAAVVAIHNWSDDQPFDKTVVTIDSVNEYIPGRFFERELPCLIAAIQAIQSRCPDHQVETIVVDGNVRLDEQGRPGLGQYVFDHFQQSIPVIGVAKSPFNGLNAIQVLRGVSTKPLFITAAGIEESAAADWVKAMAGEYRIPTMLRLVDAMSRGNDLDADLETR